MINEIFEKLPQEQQDELIYSLEVGNTCVIEYTKGKVIGVYLPNNGDFTITETNELFSIGERR